MSARADADAEIRSVLARIAQLADTTEDLDDYLALFTEDAVWGMPANPAVDLPANQKHGRAEIRAGVEERRSSGIQGPGTNTRHILTTIAVDVESDTRATAALVLPVRGLDHDHPDDQDHRAVRRRLGPW